MTLPIGVNTFVWHSPLTDDLLDERLRQIAAWGFEAVELPSSSLATGTRSAADLAGRARSGQCGRCRVRPGRELAAATPEVIESTQEYVRSAIGSRSDRRHRWSSARCTPRSAAPGGRRRPNGERSQRSLRKSLAGWGVRRRARRTARIEPLNRYETSLLKTAEQVMELIDPLPAEAIGVNLDTYHMNIEETSFRAAFGPSVTGCCTCRSVATTGAPQARTTSIGRDPRRGWWTPATAACSGSSRSPPTTRDRGRRLDLAVVRILAGRAGARGWPSSGVAGRMAGGARTNRGEDVTDDVEAILAAMTLEEKLAQLVSVWPQGLAHPANPPTSRRCRTR